MPSLILTNKTLSTLFHKKCVGELFTRTMAVATIKQVSNTPHLNLWLRKSYQMKTYHLTLFKKTTTFSFLGRLLLNHDLLFNRKDKNILYVLTGYCMFFYVFWIFCVKKVWSYLPIYKRSWQNPAQTDNAPHSNLWLIQSFNTSESRKSRPCANENLSGFLVRTKQTHILPIRTQHPASFKQCKNNNVFLNTHHRGIVFLFNYRKITNKSINSKLIFYYTIIIFINI